MEQLAGVRRQVGASSSRLTRRPISISAMGEDIATKKKMEMEDIQDPNICTSTEETITEARVHIKRQARSRHRCRQGQSRLSLVGSARHSDASP